MATLKIIFCILACIAAAATVPVGIFFGMYCLIPIVCAVVFALGMTWCKSRSDPKPKPRPDFMNTPEENERINKKTEDR